MAKNKENLQKLLEFLDKSILHEPENKWFVEELRKRINPIGSGGNCKETKEKIDKIEKYLGLDYELDSAYPLIDYKFIKDQYLRECFESDWREMMRWYCGTRNHSKDFSEFCRYALIQLERLLNTFYFNTHNGNFEDIKAIILQYATWATIGEKVKTIEGIPFAVKFDAFKKEYNINKDLSDIIDKIRDVRNTTSHGSSVPDSNEKFFQKHYEELLNQGYPTNSIGLVDWAELKKDPQLYNVYHNFKKNTDEHQLYIKLSWQLKKKPFDEVYKALSEFVEVIKSKMTI